ncbi:DUF177 domain-containing protein [Serpentinicella sp. ANB-PHB4]|uniref:YceD family protein n=1 Tax=Serpentinicella sp. ANB-PHB4 TaxID=3074076 RepID=UPI00285CD5FF|nr:DUF177 domain-containing protein [Serpentinicella sp. ANB-PHB4]MDR5658302.1 DUF177 domain-containing protein [Serpentinicella sp. ANB-PHB4]
MKFDLTEIKHNNSTKKDIDFTIELEHINYNGDLIKVVTPANVIGVLYDLEGKTFFVADVKTKMRTKCSRCLKGIDFNYNTNVNIELIHEDNANEEKLNEDVYIYNDIIINLDEIVEEAIITNIPMKILCTNDCRGLCTQCGKNLNDGACNCELTESDIETEGIDPRLLKLKQFFKNE